MADPRLDAAEDIDIDAAAAPITNDGSAMMDRRVFNERYTDDLDDLIRRRAIRVLVTMNRTNFFLADAEPRGFQYDLMQKYRDYLRTRVRTRSWPVLFIYIPTTVEDMIPDLIEGRGDIAAANLTVTPEREKSIAFTSPFFSNVKQVVVHAAAMKDLVGIDDLAGRSVYVKAGTSYVDNLKNLNESFGSRGLDPVTIVELSATLSADDVLELVNAGIIGITVADGHYAEAWDDVLPEIIVRPDLIVHEGGSIAWAVRKDNPELRKSLSVITSKHRRGSLIGNIFFQRYYQNVKWIESPLTETQVERLHELQDLMEEYGEKYGFDWLMLSALAFQESRLDNEVRSQAGAVGLMQVLPTTAEGPPISIPDVHLLENNIHAGTKYLAFLRENYFNEPAISPADKVDFTLAAYNAGPNRITRLRKAAEQAGLDPNVWFGNVEQIARRVIGRETVDYVANINKYYIAYKLAGQLWVERTKALGDIKEKGAD